MARHLDRWMRECSFGGVRPLTNVGRTVCCRRPDLAGKPEETRAWGSEPAIAPTGNGECPCHGLRGDGVDAGARPDVRALSSGRGNPSRVGSSSAARPPVGEHEGADLLHHSRLCRE